MTLQPKSIEVKGKTVDDAIMKGLTQLALGIDEVDIDIIHEGSKGIFGFGRSALVRITQSRRVNPRLSSWIWMKLLKTKKLKSLSQKIIRLKKQKLILKPQRISVQRSSSPSKTQRNSTLKLRLSRK